MGWRQETARLLALLAIRFYRRWLSRFTPHCHLKPICSTYALHAVREHGARVGLQMTVDRLATCRSEQENNRAPLA
jgi:putative component of membrane protein insertase Oxa1/YidC/SpoIIIJ protein YidD